MEFWADDIFVLFPSFLEMVLMSAFDIAGIGDLSTSMTM